jgi:hypothetical protein
LGFKVSDFGFRVSDVGFRVEDLGRPRGLIRESGFPIPVFGSARFFNPQKASLELKNRDVTFWEGWSGNREFGFPVPGLAS